MSLTFGECSFLANEEEHKSTSLCSYKLVFIASFSIQDPVTSLKIYNLKYSLLNFVFKPLLNLMVVT